MFVEEIRRAVQATHGEGLPNCRLRCGRALRPVRCPRMKPSAWPRRSRRARQSLRPLRGPPSRLARGRGHQPPWNAEGAWTGSGWMPPAIAARFTMGEPQRLVSSWPRSPHAADASCRSAPLPAGQGCVSRSSATPSGRPGRWGCCTSRPGAWLAIATCRTSSRSSAGSSSYGSGRGHGSSGRGVGADLWCRPPTIF